MLNFARIAPCFPGKIYPTDVDGIVEIGGSFLMIEWKDTRRTRAGAGDWRGGDFPVPQKGQLLTLQALSRLRDFTVLVIYGDGATMNPVAYRHFRDGRIMEPRRLTFAGMENIFERWVVRAKEQAA